MKKLLISLLPGGLFSIAAPVIFYVMKTDNKNENAWFSIIGSILLCLVVFGILFALAYLATKSIHPAGVIAAILVIGLFYLWPVALTVAAVVVVSLAALLIVRRKISFLQINILLGMLSLVITVFYGVQFARLFIGMSSISSETSHPAGDRG